MSKTPSLSSSQNNAKLLNLSRRGFLGSSVGAFVMGISFPKANAATKTKEAGTDVQAFLEIRPDNTILFRSPFNEGGQGIFTSMAQLVGEELDLAPEKFVVENAPPGDTFRVIPKELCPPGRWTGGSMSVRTSHLTMRRLGALTRKMLLEAAAQKLHVPLSNLKTDDGKVICEKLGKSFSYGTLAPLALKLPVPNIETITLKDESQFRWIGKALKRLDVKDKATGKAVYSIDITVNGMMHAAIQHAPRLGMTAGQFYNEAQVKEMRGVHSIHRLEGAVAVVAPHWWEAKLAVEALQVDWQEPAHDSNVRYMPADFSTEKFREFMAKQKHSGETSEEAGDIKTAFSKAATLVQATGSSQYLRHAQLEPPSALARFNKDGSLELWMPNQQPEVFQEDAAKRAGLPIEKVILHSPLLGGFFGRHFLVHTTTVYPQAIALAKATGKPIKVIWSREEEFLRDSARPMSVVHFKGALDSKGIPTAIEAIAVTEGPTEGIANKKASPPDPTAVEGLTEKSYDIPHRRIAQLYVKTPVMLSYWRSVGHSMNDFFYETFLDELAEKGRQDPYQLRLHLLANNPRLTNLLKGVAELSGGWKSGVFTAADGSRRARGIGMASSFGSEAAAIAEVSIENGEVRVHHVWQAIDPGKVINPAIIEAQVNSGTALALSQVLMEELAYQDGMPIARNYDLYPILPPHRMAKVHVKIIESGEKIGGIGEPPLPPVPPAVANAVSTLTGKRIRSMPLSQYKF
ncbi:xanthine dehydrogenase family protein molybdopterin-binding subunit [Acetobacteraceae bacterium]|nr:xanthine dehydrogenase family protein molybdopterin-binding subunit [Acetobacteraceae bacterium]